MSMDDDVSMRRKTQNQDYEQLLLGPCEATKRRITIVIPCRFESVQQIGHESPTSDSEVIRSDSQTHQEPQTLLWSVLGDLLKKLNASICRTGYNRD